MQDHQEACRQWFRTNLSSGCPHGRKMPSMRKSPRCQAGPLRRIYGLQQLPRVQVYQEEDAGNGLPGAELQWRVGGEEIAPRGKDILRLRPISKVPVHSLEQACQ